eukprot:3472608-Rhodomonas_salina.1
MRCAGMAPSPRAFAAVACDRPQKSCSTRRSSTQRGLRHSGKEHSRTRVAAAAPAPAAIERGVSPAFAARCACLRLQKSCTRPVSSSKNTWRSHPGGKQGQHRASDTARTYELTRQLATMANSMRWLVARCALSAPNQA